METGETATSAVSVELIQDANKTESAENFQKFIYELFDKNGILNDLRAYLRGHIVDVLKNSQTGDPPSCQKRFTQRLEPSFQALNMLIAEYLLTMEFGYSLSVFVSEIPLANMVFDFANSLMDLSSHREATELHFKETDVWSILNYLGVKCDAEYAKNVINMYNMQKDSPLLLCIFKCLHSDSVDEPSQSNPPDSSISSSSRSSVDQCCRSPAVRYKCKHYECCKTCRARFSYLKARYKKKKAQFSQNVKDEKVNPHYVDILMKRIGMMERNLIEEMFDELKSVHEAEVGVVKAETEEQIRRSFASHALHFQQSQIELEESFKTRKASLKSNIERKKRFLWGLARALRDQHSHMTKAMRAVKLETERLAQKEKIFRNHLKEAEELLRKRGEDMRQQVTHELRILEGHLQSMKSEREIINRERSELDRLRTTSEMKLNKLNNVEEIKNNDLRVHNEQLRQELVALKRYLERCRVEPKCVVECGTITNISGVNSRISVVKSNDGERGPVVNNLNKQKNVNFSEVIEEPPPEQSRSGSPSSGEGGDGELARLVADNRRLMRVCQQQSAQLSTLSARLQGPLRMPPAPARAPASISASASADAFGWCKGAGEELSSFCLSGRPPVLLPGDTLPFIGVVGERRADTRRHLINQWRSLRRRVFPTNKHSSSRRSSPKGRPNSVSSPPSTHRDLEGIRHQGGNGVSTTNHSRPKAFTIQKTREKSPKSVLKEAKERLRSVHRPTATRETSPSATLREAKARLRKLEIEAEAVERSYMDFRRRRGLRNTDVEDNSNMKMPMNMNYEERSRHSQQQNPYPSKINNTLQEDIDKYLKYQHNLNIGLNHYKNRNTTAAIRDPIPKDYSEIIRQETVPTDNYLDKSLAEFRRLYTQPDRKKSNEDTAVKLQHITELNSSENSARREEISKEKRASIITPENTQRELESLKEEFEKRFDVKEEKTKEIDEIPPENREKINTNDKNLLRVEVEKTSELNDLKGSSDQSVVLLVEKSEDLPEVDLSGSDDARDSIPTRMTLIVSPKRTGGPDSANGTKPIDVEIIPSELQIVLD